jgi:hypothetical protein
MPITGTGWEIHFQRTAMQRNPSTGRFRTVGRYQVFFNGVPQPGVDLSGAFAERPGPGNNGPHGKTHGLRIEAGRYPLFTQDGTKYKTHGFADSNMINVLPRPGVELKETGHRSEILFHPGIGFLASIGCLNLCTDLPDGSVGITYTSSRRRVINVIGSMSTLLGAGFPSVNGRRIENAFAVIDGEP